MQVIVSDKITLKSISLDFAENIFNLSMKNKKVFEKWFPWIEYTKSVEDSISFITECLEKEKNETDLVFSIFYEKVLIGSLGIHNIKSSSREIGYWLDEDYYKKGIMTQCVKWAIDFCFNKLDLESISIRFALLNEKSQNVAKRLDFTPDNEYMGEETVLGQTHLLLKYNLNKSTWILNNSSEDNGVILKKAESKDKDILYHIQKDAFKKLYDKYKDISNPFNQSKDRFDKVFEIPSIYYYKIIKNGEICGGIYCDEISKGSFWIHRIYISEHLQNQGIGQCAISLLIKQHPKIKKWQLDTPLSEGKNLSCYNACGFYDTGIRNNIDKGLTLAILQKDI